MTYSERYCRVCDERDVALLVKNKSSAGGVRMLCRRCHLQQQQWRFAGADKAAASVYWRQYRKDHPVERARWAAARRERLSEELNRRAREARAKDPLRSQKARVNKLARRAREASSVCLHATAAEIATLSMECQLCPGPAQELDHIVPLARGGCSNLHNLQWLCRSCNRQKSWTLVAPECGCPVWNEEFCDPGDR